MRHKNTKAMLDYWMELFLAANDDFEQSPEQFVWPERSDLQPSSCRDLLGEMFILEETSTSCTYRLAGTKLCSMFGREMKRESFAQTFEAEDKPLAADWISKMSKDNYLVLLCIAAHTAQGHTLNLETLLMPLKHHGQRNGRVLGITVPEKTPNWLGMVPLVSQRIRSVRIIRPWEKNAFKANWPFEIPKQLVDVERPLSVSPPALYKEHDDTAPTSVLSTNGHTHALDGRQVAHLRVFEGGKQ